GFRLRRVGPDGTIDSFAGSSICTGNTGQCDSGDVPASSARFGHISAVAVAPDGSVLVADDRLSVIRRVRTDGIVSFVAGVFPGGVTDEGAPAQNTGMRPVAIRADRDGSILYADLSHSATSIAARVRRIGIDGLVYSVMGDLGPCAQTGTQDNP